MEIRRVSLIAPKPTVPLGASHYLGMLFWGLPLLGTILHRRGYEVRVFFEIIDPIDWDYVYSSQVVGFQTLACTMHRTVDIIRSIKERNPGAVTVLGGTLPTSLPEDMLQYCDFVVRQEGDETLPDLLDALQTGRDLREVLGISYKVDDDRVVDNPDRPLVQDLDVIPDLSLVKGWSEFNLLRQIRRRRLQWHVVQTSRGCPYSCSFCIVPMMFHANTYRVRSVDSVVEEIKGKIAASGCRRFMFVDNMFAGDRKHAKVLLRRIIDENIRFSCFAFTRLDIYKDVELLGLMKQANLGPLFIGFESFNDTSLQSWEKHQTTARVIEAIKTIKDAGLTISGSFIIGADEDTVDSIRNMIDSALRYGVDHINIFPLGAMPGRGPQPLPRRRQIMLDYDFGSGNHVTTFPRQMKPSTLQKEYFRAYRSFNNVSTALQSALHGNIASGIERFAAHMAHEAIIADVEKRYLPRLYEIEEGMYDEHERLLEDRLPPNGFLGPGIILPPEHREEVRAQPQLVQTLGEPECSGDGHVNGRNGTMAAALAGGDGLDELVRAHTLDMALRKCYGGKR